MEPGSRQVLSISFLVFKEILHVLFIREVKQNERIIYYFLEKTVVQKTFHPLKRAMNQSRFLAKSEFSSPKLWTLVWRRLSEAGWMAERDERFSEAYIIRSVPRSQSPCSVADSLSLSLSLLSLKGRETHKGREHVPRIEQVRKSERKEEEGKERKAQGEKFPLLKAFFPSLFLGSDKKLMELLTPPHGERVGCEFVR